MKVRFHWGTGITLFIIIFFFLIGWFLWFANTHKVDLVEKDYYQKELEYQQQINRQHRSSPYRSEFKVEIIKDTLRIQYPRHFKPGNIQGEILLYRPSDLRQDKHYVIQTDSNLTQYIPIPQINSGKYIVKANILFSDSSYYFEESIHIP